MPEDKNLLIKISLAQALANYLSAQPYREVVALLAQLQQLQPAPEISPDGFVAGD